MNNTDNKFRHWLVTLQGGKEVYTKSPEACDSAIAFNCAKDWLRSTYGVLYDVLKQSDIEKVVGFNDRFDYKGLSVERRFAKIWYQIDTLTISDKKMMQLVAELYTILTTCFDDFNESDVEAYIRGEEHLDIEQARDRLEKELLLEYGGVLLSK